MTQRIALVFLPPRVALWRYQRGSRSLVDNFGSGEVGGDAAGGAGGAGGGGASGEGSSAAGAEEEDDTEVPDELDELVDVLLTGLRDRDTVVRWSAAKGIGRLTGRLPHRDWADEIVGAVLELFSAGEFALFTVTHFVRILLTS